MSNVIEIKELVKKYPAFTLDHVSFNIEAGQIVGFIGRNGAGKTTTLKCIYNLIHRDSGEIKVFGEEFINNELALKQKIGFMLGGVDYYAKTKLKKLTNITKMFYSEWDEEEYKKYIKEFELDENKRVNELSEGMKVKYNLAVALSHHAELLILDEPTSGLDPVSRDEIIEIFLKLVSDHKKAILFSTHITTDLEKCADRIVYIHKGKIIANDELDAFHYSYIYITGDSADLTDEIKVNSISYRYDKRGFEALAYAKDKDKFSTNVNIAVPDLDTIMILREREEK